MHSRFALIVAILVSSTLSIAAYADDGPPVLTVPVSPAAGPPVLSAPPSSTSETSAGPPVLSAPDGKSRDVAPLSPDTKAGEPNSMPGGASSTSPALTAPVSDEPSAGPGPLLEKRRALLSRIQAAQNRGIGIGSYLGEFNRIERLVKTSAPESQYSDRIDELSGALDEQIKRAQVLKSQIIPPAVSRSRRGPGLSSAPQLRPGMEPPGMGGGRSMGMGGATRMGGAGGGNVMDMLRGPGGLSALQNLSPEQKEKLLQSDQAKALMKKYLGN